MEFTKITEQDSLHNKLEQKNIRELLTGIHQEDQKIIGAVELVLSDIETLISSVVDQLQKGGRLFYIGAGTSGRLGILDASECPPTFGSDPGQVIGVIAGGKTAVYKAVENAEDNIELANDAVMNKSLSSHDVVIGLAASGNTPFTCKVMQEAYERNALTISISNNPEGNILKFGKIKIFLDTKEEVIAGSTRLKAGTAQKACLNIISSMVMIKMGKVKNGYMLDMVPTNEKLRKRKIIIVSKT